MNVKNYYFETYTIITISSMYAEISGQNHYKIEYFHNSKL